jgi:hypothetical protein
MENIDILNSVTIKAKKNLYKTPNTVDQFYGKDIENSFLLDVHGSDIFTSHILQKTNWEEIDVSYQWNSLGLRGPEPNYSAKKKILFGGGSLSLGTGIPVEKSFPHVLSQMLDASYINLSDVDTISDLIEPLEKFKDFNPDIVVINDTRFIQLYGWALIDIYKVRNVESGEFYKNVFLECDQKFLLMFESYLKNLFPNAELILAYCVRRAFKNPMPAFKYFKEVRLEKKEVVDIARDNAHPGIQSHSNFAKKIFSAITQK